MLPQWLAQISPLSPEFQLGLISILGVAVLVQSLRRKPPIGEDLIQLRSAIEALNKSVGQLTEAHQKHVTHSAEIETLHEKVRTLERQREEDQRSNRAYTANSNEKIFRRIDELAESVSKNFQSVERALGQLEGKVSALARE